MVLGGERGRGGRGLKISQRGKIFGGGGEREGVREGGRGGVEGECREQGG